MVQTKWYDDFIKNLNKKNPNNKLLATELMDLLGIERTAVYRRLRKEILFSFDEIEKIAVAWNISIDKIMAINSDKISFEMYPLNYFNPTNENLDYIQGIIKKFKNYKNSINSEYIEICNKLPRSLIFRFPNISKFYVFVWLYQYDDECFDIPYSNVSIPEKIQKIMTDYYLATSSVNETSYIFDNYIFDHYVERIRYFHDIDLITDEEIKLLKKDLLSLLKYLSAATKLGILEDTKNKINFYISKINIETNYSYFCANDFKSLRINVFSDYEIKNHDFKTVLYFQKIIKSIQRTSIKISETDEIYRKKYFLKQEDLINSL